MTDAELEPQLSILNPHPTRVPGPRLLHQLVQLTSNESLPAIHSLNSHGEESTLSYAQFHDAADALAARISRLVAISSTSDDFIIPILIPQCSHLYISMLAVLKAGGAFCPLHLDAPPERVRFILQDVSAKVVLVTRDLVSKMPHDADRVVLVVDEEVTDDLTSSTSLTTRHTEPQHLSYVMYTSGSTGTPKGVGVSHDAATQSLLAHDRHIPSFRRFLQFASPTFDVSVFEIFFPLLRGSTLVTCDRGRMLNDLPDVIRTLQVDACELTPTVAGSLLRSRQNAPCLKLLLTIGEMLTESVVREFGGSDVSDSMLWGMYGPTEAAIHCTLRPRYPTDCPSSNIGFPLDSVSCFVVAIPEDDSPFDFNILPVGELGELVVGGYQLANGYLNRPEQTDAAFFNTPQGRVYRTGDKAIMNSDGTMECLGRISDGQVKLRGQRIELGEVEQAAMRATGCHSAIAMVLGGILVAFCAIDDQLASGDHVEDILNTCRTWLPSFMVPGDIVIKTSFPRLPSGKVDRKQLMNEYKMSLTASQPEDHFEAASPLERKALSIVSTFLDSQISPSASLASMGIDSLKAIRLASALREGGFRASATDILNSMTLSALFNSLQATASTSAIDQEDHMLGFMDPCEIHTDQLLGQRADLTSLKDEIARLQMCTPLQNSMLAETSVNPQAYCNWIKLEFPAENTTQEVLQWTYRIAQNNEILRSGFVSFDHRFAQIIYRKLPQSSIQIVPHLDENYSLVSDESYLRPLKVQILERQQGLGPIVLFQMHHALYDGWSADMLIKDFSTIADGGVPETRPQFRDVSRFYAEPATKGRMDEAREFWADHLLGWQRHNLPRLMGRPADVVETRTAVKTMNISQSVLMETGSRLQCHPQVFFQAATLWLWAGLQGQTDLVIGSVSSGRTVPVTNIERIMGPCIMTTPLRVNLAGTATIADLVRHIQATNRGALQHGILPLADIKRIAGVNPGDALFDVLFVYQESLYSQQAKQGHVREMSHQDFLETNLLVEIEPSAESPVCRLTYHTTAFTAEHAEILMKQLESVVSHLILEPKSPVETIGKSLSQGLTSIFNVQPATLSTIPDLAAMFELSASATPGATAIRFAKSLDDGDVDTMTYSSLNSSANKIARHLHNLGAREGGIVGIIMEKSISLYAAILGILKAGCAYLPLLPTTPKDRIRLILTQAEVSICIANAAVSSSLGDLSSCQFVDALSIDTLNTMEDNLGLSVDPSRPAYVIYTSGTTGTPKGVVVTQKNTVSNLDVLSRIYPHSNTSRFLQACSQAFDVSVFEIFFTWKVGACLCSGTNDTLFEDLERAIQFLGCTHLSMTPTVASLVNPRNVPAVNFLVTAGEPMTALVAEKWTGLLYQGYGPAETTNICTVKKMKPGDFIDHLGFSFDNTSTFVLGSTMTDPVPIGCVGELCFGGDQVAAGYLGMKNLTELKFLDHPQFGRIYRSGDMGRMLPDGSLMVLGRMDDQLKLRGQRIDTGEISSILTTSSIATSSVVVIVSNATTSTSQLAVFYVPARQSYDDFGILPIDEGLFEANNTLLGLLRSRLPTYMIPSYLVPINSVPLTSSGKVDRARLQVSFRDLSRDYIDRAAGSLHQKEDESFWSEAERTVRTAVSRTTNVAAEDIARWQPFAALGLDSISVIPLARALQASFDRRVPVSTILRTGCVARLAQEILADTSTTTSTAFCASALLPREFVEEVKRGFAEDDKSVSSVLPCTPLQEAMLSSTTGSSYSNQMIFRLHVSDTDMKSYWEQMHCRHGILRTCFVSTRDPKRAVAQVVLDSVPMAWDLIEAGSLEEAASQHVEGLPDAVDSKIPPLSLAILKVVGDVYLAFACHHALYDGVAMDALLLEVEQLAAGKTLPLPLKYEPILAEILQSPDGSSSFWKNHFDGFKPAQHILSAGGSQLPGSATPIIAMKPLNMPLSQIQAICKASGVSMLSYFQTAWSVFLTLVYEESEICFGNVMSGRALSVDGIDRLVAPCFNTLPVRVEVPPSTESMTLLKKFQNINPLLLEHQFTPLRSIQTQVSKSGIQLFDSLLLLQQHRPDRDPCIWELVEDNGTMDVPLVCELVPSPVCDLMTVRLHSNSPFMAQEASVGLLDTFLHVAQHIAMHPASRVPIRDQLAPETRQALERLKIEKISETVEHSDAEAASITEEWSQAEDQLRSIISELSMVPVSNIRKTTTIFQLGLDSINAVQLAAMMRKQGLELSALDVIESPTCAKLAIRLRSVATQGTSQYDFAKFEQAVRDSSSAGDFVKILPCSPLQSAMLNDFIQSEGKDYLNYMAFLLNEDICMDRVEDAWAALLDHHEILRTGFISTQLRDASFAMVQTPATRSQLRITIHNHAFDSFSVTKWKLDTAHTILSSLQQSPWALALESTSSGITMHVLMHHALYDAYSFQLILQDLSAFLSGAPMFQHAPIENGLSQILQASLDTSQAEAFWQQKAPEVVVNRFPTLTPLTEESPESIVEKRVSSMDFTQLSENARRVGVSIQGALQATWTRILSAYLGEEDVVFGIVLSGRMSDETRNVILPCITTLPVVAHNRSSNSELVQQMLDYNNQLLKHQNAPLAQVQRWLGYPNARVFDTLLVYQRMPTDDTPNFPWKVVSDEGNLDYPVSFEVEPLPDGKVQLRLSFKTNILPKAQAIHLLDQFDAVLRHLVECPEQTADDLWASDPSIFSIIPPLEPTIHSEEPFLHTFVETKAETHPDKIALEFVTGFDGETPISRQWSFRELNQKGNQVAHVLSPHAKVGETIAIHFDKCPEACFVILGILKSGCAFLALDPSAPKARKEFILKDSGALVLLTNVNIDFTVEQPIIHIDDTSLSHQPQQFIAPAGLSVQDNSYCLYTSGTTGTPKGCEITHENAVQAMKAFQRLFDGHWDEKSKWMQFASFHFDVSVLEQYWSWSVGMTLVGAPRDLILDDLAGTIRRLNITHIDLTPSLARLLDPAEVPSLSRGNGVFITGGEALKQEILDVWGPIGIIYNAYGPTEATIGVTMYQRVPQNGRASNIGKQFDNVGSYVLHPGTDIPVMKGGVGELCVSGKLVGKGYLKRPELTQERFPFLERHGERVYRTGDLVRVLHDGCFDFLGRADDQVKLRGQRLEIGEINHSIRTRVREVSDVATLVTKHGSLDKDLLVTFFSCTSMGASKDELQVLNEENTGPLVRSVQKACRDTLPGYMVPSYIFHVPRIPLSPNNKADIKQLNQLFRTITPEKLVQLSSSSSTASKPINDTQRLVLSKMREFLGENTNVSLSSNIFDLGVDSISALRLSRLLRKGGLAGASPQIILRNPGLGDLAETLQESQSSNESSSVQEARQLIHAFGHRYRSLAVQELGLTNDRDIEYVAPCTPLQEGMLSRFMSDQDEGAYFTAFRLKLAPAVSITKLKNACENMVRAHAILRTSFIQTPAGFAQVAVKSVQLSWRDFRDRSPAEIEPLLSSALPDLIHQNSRSVSNPLELIVAQIGEETILVVHIFHALYDGSSFESMLRWVSAEYLNKEHETPPTFLDTLAHGPLANYDSSRQFWVDHLSDCSFDTLPRLRSGDPAAIITKTKTYSARNLETLRRSLNVTLQSVVLALWASVFKKHFPGNAATGVIVSGRSIDMEQVENTIGPLFNTLLFYAGLKEGDTWLSLIQKCHEFNTSVLQFQHVPLRNIQKWCSRSRGRPIFENLFVFQIEGPRSTEPSGMWSIMDDYSVSDYPVAFEASATSDGQLRVQVVAHRDVADEAMMNSLFEEIDDAIVDVTSRATCSLPVTANPSREASTTASPRTPLTSRPESTDEEISKDYHLELSMSDFEWTPSALDLRKEIAALAGASEDSITENMALLELGLDSIDLVKLSARLKHNGYELTLSQLMRAQTIAAMSRILSNKKATSAEVDHELGFEKLKSQLWKAVESTQFNLDDAEAVLPPTPLQESMMAEMLQSDFDQYFNHDILELAGGLDLDKFEGAWKLTVEHSPILRTVFVQIEDPKVKQTFAQVVLKSNLPTLGKFGEDQTEPQDVIQSHKENAQAANGQGNLLQLSLLSTSSKSLLILSISHALYDGWSLALLHQDVAAAYQSQLVERPLTEPFLRDLVKTPTDQSRKFWSQYLANTQPSLMSERQSADELSRNVTHRTEAVSSINQEQVTAFCKRHAVSLQVLGQACWASVVATLLQSLEITFGVVLAGRDSEQSQALMFPTMNTVAVRCFLHGSTTSFLRYLQETMGDITEFQNYPLRKAQNAVGGRLFNTLFILQKSPNSGPDNVQIMKSVQGSSATDFAVCAELETTPDTLVWRIAGQDAYVSERMTDQLLHQLDRVLRFIINTPDDNLLCFEGDQVSICQLPKFHAKTITTLPSETTPMTRSGANDVEWTTTESTIRRILSRAADVEVRSIGKSHTLYNLGLDSISAIKVAALLRKEGVNLGIRALLTSSSIKEMACQAQTTPIDVSSETQDIASRYKLPTSINTQVLLSNSGLSESCIEEILPPLPMQVYMVSAWQNARGHVFYPDFFYRLKGLINIDQLQSGWVALVDSEPILRTCLVATGKRSLPFVQIILRTDLDGPHKRIVIDGQGPTPTTKHCYPQVQLNAKQEDAESWALKLRIHHSLYDGFSLPALMQKLQAMIQSKASDMAVDLGPWRAFLASNHAKQVKDHDKIFWSKYLDGVNQTLGESYEDSSGPLSRVSLLKHSVIPEVGRLQKCSAQAGVGLPALFFAATARALQKFRGQGTKDIIFGIYFANRSSTEALANTLPTLNLVPLKVSLTDDPDLLQTAKQVQDDLHHISSHATVGLWEIKEWTGLEIDCFVNFLHLGEENSEMSEASSISLELISSDFSPSGIFTDSSDGSEENCSARWLQNNVVRDVFPDALDVEASINAGGMDIGVFGASTKVSESTADDLIGLLGGILKGL
ncbi:amino acid adenylation domain-containing protein [Colletotrichum godetiae]|uniref:Amino acid adenylation domain-containing protein n=1 Tax=Colletotrichum godetiae TaxID=1209918 RepID=A0AAJ0EXL5_9PEZI|nr:amino acid adenylation domain-containing protein [Colletotrichum godetiae]KAK1675309.1 amino acid adenylation domain-containing protein [Colletotrichum godetiae]